MRFKARTLEGFYALLLIFPFVFTLTVFFLYAFLRTLFLASPTTTYSTHPSGWA